MFSVKGGVVLYFFQNNNIGKIYTDTQKDVVYFNNKSIMGKRNKIVSIFGEKLEP